MVIDKYANEILYKWVVQGVLFHFKFIEWLVKNSRIGETQSGGPTWFPGPKPPRQKITLYIGWIFYISIHILIFNHLNQRRKLSDTGLRNLAANTIPSLQIYSYCVRKLRNFF